MEEIQESREGRSEGIDNFVLVIGLYNLDSCVPNANFLPLICRLVVLKM